MIRLLLSSHLLGHLSGLLRGSFFTAVFRHCGPLFIRRAICIKRPIFGLALFHFHLFSGRIAATTSGHLIAFYSPNCRNITVGRLCRAMASIS